MINTKNAAATLQDALESVPMASEIIVVDMQSTDNTKEIARKFTPKIFNHPDTHYVEPARNFALRKATEEWTLILDADECLSASLQEKLASCIEKATEQGSVCIYLPRKNFVFGAWLKHTGWWPDYLPRLFRTGSVDWPEKIHALPQVQGTSWYAPASELYCIEHKNYSSIDEYFEKMGRYTSAAAAEAKLPQTTTAEDVLSTFFSEFLRRFFLQEGFKDGVRGSALSLLQSTYQVLTQVKIWELSNHSEGSEAPAQSIVAVQHITRDLNYWVADYYAQRTTGLVRIFWRIRRFLRR